MNRLQTGSCKMVNPYNRHVSNVFSHSIMLMGLCFKPKIFRPLFGLFDGGERKGISFYHPAYHYWLSTRARRKGRSFQAEIEHIKEISLLYGPQVVVWRYDPILITSLTSLIGI